MVEPEIRGEMIDIACLPSLTRLCMNVIVLPEKGSCKNIVKEIMWPKKIYIKSL